MSDRISVAEKGIDLNQRLDFPAEKIGVFLHSDIGSNIGTEPFDYMVEQGH